MPSAKRNTRRKRGRRRNTKKKKKTASSPDPFVRTERAPRTPGRPYNPRTPVRSTGGRPKGKGKKHIVARTPGGKDYYCGDVSIMRRLRRRDGVLEPRKTFLARRHRKLRLSLALCEKEKALRRNVRSDYDRRSNELWKATVHSLMRRYVTSLRAMKRNPEQSRLLKRLRDSFGNEGEEDLADEVARKLFISRLRAGEASETLRSIRDRIRAFENRSRRRAIGLRRYFNDSLTS